MPRNTQRFIGLMSGTSVDSIDAAICDFEEHTLKVIATHSHEIPGKIKNQIADICTPTNNEIDKLGQLDIKLGKLFAQAVNATLQKSNIPATSVLAIGSHGQTVRHRPNFITPFTLQIGDPNTIALDTGITTIADFRRKDMAAGGQGAPLAPAFHDYIFRRGNTDRYIVNIGGIANITRLTQDAPTSGSDVGPGNTLLDAWILKHKNLSFDTNGEWAASGKVHTQLLREFKAHDFFKRPTPKSTGREDFCLDWLHATINKHHQHLKPEDVQATLSQLTADAITQQIQQDNAEIFLCGGGVKNTDLVERIKRNFVTPSVYSTTRCGLDPDWVEAAAFAWLAMRTFNRQTGNLPNVTGALDPQILGGIYCP